MVQTKRREAGRWVTVTVIYDVPQGESAQSADCVDFPRPVSPRPENPRSYEELTTNDCEEVGHLGDHSGLPAGSSLRNDRIENRVPRARKRRVLTKEARHASWLRFRSMDLGDLSDDINIRGSAFCELEEEHGAIEPDCWAQAKIDAGQWDGFCASWGIGDKYESPFPKSA